MPKGFKRQAPGQKAAEVAAKRPKISLATIKRLYKMIIAKYKFLLLLVILCIVLSSVVSVSGLMFIQTIIDDFIEPLLIEKQKNPDVVISFAEFAKLISRMIVMYVSGSLATLIYNRIMVRVSEGTLKDIRDTMFVKMQK